MHLDLDSEGTPTRESIAAWAKTFAQQDPNAPDQTILPPDVVLTRNAIALLDDIASGAVAAFAPGITIGEGGMGLVRAAEQRASPRCRHQDST